MYACSWGLPCIADTEGIAKHGNKLFSTCEFPEGCRLLETTEAHYSVLRWSISAHHRFSYIQKAIASLAHGRARVDGDPPANGIRNHVLEALKGIGKGPMS